jgi:hypothetical protein
MMWQQRVAQLKRFAHDAWVATRPHVRRAGVAAVTFVRGPLRSAALVIAQTVAALVVLFLEWGWGPLERALAGLSKYLVFARLEAWVRALPPYGALALFAAPAVCLFPLKLLALYLFATGHPVLGIGLIAAAKIVGTAIVARIFILTQPRLMEIGWFKAGYDRFMPWKEAMFAHIRASAAWRTGRAVRVSVKRWINRTWLAWAPQRAKLIRAVLALRTDVVAWLANLAKGLR